MFASEIKQLKRQEKQFMMIVADIILLPLALWIALSLRLSNAWPIQYYLNNTRMLMMKKIIKL